MTDKEAYDFMCSLNSDTGHHIKLRYIQLRDPESLISIAQEHMRSPQKMTIVYQCVNHTFDTLIKKYTNPKSNG